MLLSLYDSIPFQSKWLIESDHYQQFLQGEEDLFSILDHSLSIDYKYVIRVLLLKVRKWFVFVSKSNVLFRGLIIRSSFTNPFKDFQTQTWFSFQDDNVVNPISTSYAAGGDHMFMASLELEAITTFSQGIYV